MDKNLYPASYPSIYLFSTVITDYFTTLMSRNPTSAAILLKSSKYRAPERHSPHRTLSF